MVPAFCPMHPEYDRDSTDHAYVPHNDQNDVTFADATTQCSTNYHHTATLPIVDTISKLDAAIAKIHKTFGKITHY